MRSWFPWGLAALFGGVATVAVSAWASPAAGQWVRASEQFYLPAPHNWVFRQNYVGVDRLFNAFDYGHAILYETLYASPNAPPEQLEVVEFDFLTQRLLKRPPRVPIEEGAVEIEYAKLVPEAKLMFEWAHVLHRQLYDILADERLSEEEKDAEVTRTLAYYRSRPDLAFSSVPKSMDLMDGQPYSLAFRQSYPRFNGLIWAYHWLQVGLYEPILVNRDVASRTAGVTATVGRFWQMLEDAPATMPYLMPMTAAVAPTFAARYPEVAIIFDNLHMMHDVISDILASPQVPRSRKRAEILVAAGRFRDDTSFAIPVEEWAAMGSMMGLNNMGGPAVGFLPPLPEPTVERGASMAGMSHSAIAGGAGVAHNPADHAPPTGSDTAADDPAGRDSAIRERLMSDPVIRARIAADPELQRLLGENGPGDSAIASSLAGPGGSPDPAIALILRILLDPAVSARIHADPLLHDLWSDPDVQRHLEARPSDEPSVPVPAAPGHEHP